MINAKNILCVLAAVLCTNTMMACTSQTDDSYSGEGSDVTVETQTSAPVYQATPTAYRSACAQAGTIETFDYTAHDDNGNAYSKQCRVYLPYGYDSSKQYDVLYLMHGFYGNIRTILEGTVGGRRLQYVVDHLIADGRMRPMIIVTPTITDYYTTSNWIKFPKEVREDLIPAIEGKYSTYSRSTSAEDLIAARNHRAFSGFSMGGTTTWNMFQYNLAYFSTFIPVSGTSWALGNEAGADVAEATAELLKNCVMEQGYGKDDFFIYAATGTNDVAYPLHTHIEAMQRLTDMFTYDYRPSNGNLCLLLAQGGRHDYDYVTDYLYVLLPHLFPAEGDVTAITHTVNDAKTSDSVLYSVSGQKMGKASLYNLTREIECTNRQLKTDLNLRPIHHQKDDRSDAHLFFGLLAYWVVNTIRYRLKQSGMTHYWSEIVRMMSTQKAITTEATNALGEKVHLRLCSEPTKAATDIYERLKYKKMPFRKIKIDKICSTQ